MSHELRTPLNAIIGVSEMLREDAEALKQDTEPLDRVLGAGRHLLALINEFSTCPRSKPEVLISSHRKLLLSKWGIVNDEAESRHCGSTRFSAAARSATVLFGGSKQKFRENDSARRV
jgi:hypothetical protein